MKTNLPGDLETLAQAAINDEATDAQLEALESAIMDSADGADILRDMAVRQAAKSSQKRGMPTVVKVVLFGSIAAAAAIVTLLGAGVLFVYSQKNQSHGSQLVAAPATLVGVNPDDPSAALNPLAAESVPEPSTSLLLVSGLTLILFRRHR
ncbi:MAG: PEP-CTERM sorting domain-containing protein [Verrucomicrobiae bacterium]|nr:PEP-CTERM sorting domain-containing protein [Verrucomicrobiae bacterium]